MKKTMNTLFYLGAGIASLFLVGIFCKTEEKKKKQKALNKRINVEAKGTDCPVEESARFVIYEDDDALYVSDRFNRRMTLVVPKKYEGSKITC